MDKARFREAEQAFESKDYRAAAEGFLSAAGGSGGPGNGLAYHMAGNALVRLRKYSHAVTVYSHALKDPEYDRRTQVLANCGVAYAALGSYAEAVAAFDAALGDASYTPRFKALSGRAGALHNMGRFAEAALAYGEAAADPANPDPGRALNNLGLSLTALGRPKEAIEAYERALATDGYTGKGKAAVNMGLLYAAAGMDAEAVRAFEMAVNGYGHQLPDSVLDMYERAKADVGEAEPSLTPEPAPPPPPEAPLVPDADASEPMPERETVEGWRTGEMLSLAGAAAEADAAAAAKASPEVPDGPESQFFTRTDAEMKELDRVARRDQKAAKRAEANPWARAASVAVAVVLVVGACAAVFLAGFGYPSQSSTVDGLLQTYKQGGSVADFWVAAPVSDIGKEMAYIPVKYRDASIDTIERGPFNSKAKITIHLDTGAPMHYTISLAREGVGWKVVGIANDWGPAGGS